MKIQFADLEGMEGYYCNIGDERLTVDEKLDRGKVARSKKKIFKNRPAHSQPVSA